MKKSLKDVIKELLQEKYSYNNIFNITNCTKKQFLEAINEHMTETDKLGLLPANFTEVYTKNGIVHIK